MSTNIDYNEEFFVVEHAADSSLKIVYAPLRSYLAVVPSEVADVLLQSEWSRLKDSFIKLLATKPKIDMGQILENMHRATPELSLAITDNCNLRCVYCHASAGEAHKMRTMPIEVIKSVLDKYFAFIPPRTDVSVNFNGGGEPTFAFVELQFAVEYTLALAKEAQRSVSFAMATNGCYGNRIRAFIVEHFRTVSLSLDGPAFIQDRQRPTASGKGSFSQVFDTAKYFVAHEFPFAFRATVSAFSLPYLQTIIDFIADEFPGKSIGLEALNPYGRGLVAIDPEIVPPDKHAFAVALAQLLEYAGKRNVNIMNSASTEYDLLRPVFCSSVGVPNWTVTTSGDVAACARDNLPNEFVFGHFDWQTGHLNLDQSKINNLHAMNVLEYPECQDCFCKYHCAGDCPDRRLSDKSDCNAIRHIARQVLTRFADGVQQPKTGITDFGRKIYVN